MDIPNLSKYLIFEDGRVWAKCRGLMLKGTINKYGKHYYGISFDDNYFHYGNVFRSDLIKLYKINNGKEFTKDLEKREMIQRYKNTKI